jgi:hypothetical protein
VITGLRASGVPRLPAGLRAHIGRGGAFALYDAALRRSRDAANPRSVGSAITSLRSSFPGPAVLSERTDFRSGRRTGPAQARVFGWSAACACFDYAGQPFTLGAGGAT